MSVSSVSSPIAALSLLQRTAPNGAPNQQPQAAPASSGNDGDADDFGGAPDGDGDRGSRINIKA